MDAINEKMPRAKAEEVHVRRASLKQARPNLGNNSGPVSKDPKKK